MGVKGVYYKLGKENTKRSIVEAGGVCWQREYTFLFQMILNLC
jgi:hypothetical protein